MLNRTLLCLAAASVLGVLTGCGGDDKGGILTPDGTGGGTPVPREMTGRWAITLTVSNCGGPTYTDTDTMTICPDDYIEGDDDPRNCEVSKVGSTVFSSCEESYDANGCRVTQRSTAESSLTDDRLEFSAEITVSYNEACGFAPWCIRIEGSGQKIGPAPDPCDSDGGVSQPPSKPVPARLVSPSPEQAIERARAELMDAILRHE